MVQNKQTTSHMSIWWIAIGAAMWGLDGVFIVTLLKHVTSSQIVWLEHMLLLFFAAPVLVWKRHELKGLGLNLGDWFAILFIAWGGSALASILFTAGFTHGNPNVVLILQKVQPVFAVLLAARLLKERIVTAFWYLLMVVLIGAYLLTFGFHIPATGGTQLIGSLYALGAAALWGGSTVMGKRLAGKLSFTTIAALRFSIALPLLTIIILVQHPNWGTLGQALTLAPVWANLLFQTLVPSLVSLLMYYRGLDGVKASHATIAELAFPATGLLLNWLILHQTIDLGQWFGFAIIWLAVLHLSPLRNEPAMPEIPAAHPTDVAC